MISGKRAGTMDRRQFIKTGTAAVAASLLPLRLSSAGEAKVLVWEIQGPPGPAFGALFTELGGLEALLGTEPDKATVLIKPNLCLPHPGKMATTTSSERVEALCAFLEEKGVKETIIADHTLQSGNRFEKTEMAKMAARHTDVKLLFANEQRHFEPLDVAGKVLKKTEVLKLIGRADLVINFATAKHHSATGVSLALKNLMGTIWNRSEFHTRLDLSQAIGDLALAVRPHLNLIDAGRVLLNGGPTGPGPVVSGDGLFASTDIVALDSVVASRYEFGGKTLKGSDIAHLHAAYENGVGEIDSDRIEVKIIEA
jgi:uncharacterized protein (DUF362 family)